MLIQKKINHKIIKIKIISFEDTKGLKLKVNLKIAGPKLRHESTFFPFFDVENDRSS